MGGSINQNVLSDFYINDPLNTMLEFGFNRQQIYYRKERGDPWPWSNDPTFQKYKFCNIFRDQDKTTKWIVNWVTPLQDNLDHLFLNLIYARMCNNPEVMNKTGWIIPGPFNPEEFINIINNIGGGKTASKVNKTTVWKDPYQIAGAFKLKLGYPYREHVIAYHLPEKIEELVKPIFYYQDTEDIGPLIRWMGDIWGYQMTMVFSHALLDLSYFYPKLINPNAEYPMGDGATPILKILNNITLDEIVKAWAEKYPNERQLLRCDAEGLLCEWRKYLVWSNGLAKKYRLYRKEK